jgi:hypothetical protein
MLTAPCHPSQGGEGKDIWCALILADLRVVNPVTMESFGPKRVTLFLDTPDQKAGTLDATKAAQRTTTQI